MPYAKEALDPKRMFTRDKYLADYNTGYDVYFYVKSDTKVQNKVFDGDANTTNKRTLKKMFTSRYEKRLNSRFYYKILLRGSHNDVNLVKSMLFSCLTLCQLVIA